MAEPTCKRPREEGPSGPGDELDCKKQRSYDDILSLLEEDEDFPNPDLSTFMTTLQRELSSDSTSAFDHPLISPDAGDPSAALSASSSLASSPKAESNEEEEEEEKERVMRRLLEASDDELGLPNREESGEVGWGGDFGVDMCDGLWEIEDEAANNQTLVQSELFM